MQTIRSNSLAVYTFSNFFFQGSRFIAQLFLAKILGPAAFGIWITLQVVLNYALSAHLGVLDASNRSIPIHIGAGNTTAACTDARFSMGSALSLSSVAAAGVLAVACIGFPDPRLTAAYVMIAAIIILQQLYQQYHFTLAAFQSFRVISYGQILLGACQIVFLPLFAWKLDLIGLIAGYLISFTCALGAVIYLTDLRFSPAFNWAATIRMIRKGAPIMLSSLMFNLMSTIDRLFIVRYYGAESLGHYSLSIIVSGALMILPMSVIQVFYPRMCQVFGESKNFKTTFLPALQSIRLLLVCMPLLIMGCALFMPPLVRLLLVQYVPGIPAMYISLAGISSLCFAVALTTYLNTIGAHYVYLLIQAATIVIGAVLNRISIAFQMHIEGIAVATACAYLFFLVAMTGVSLYLRVKGSRSRFIRKGLISPPDCL
ncbi:MAG: hypothetical protein CSA22_02420 [Deltaproteobacteria bacterium]|nr:MAG: hypothetical protein CSA22_02420 [Deltaproteobacteria bacterium]